MAWFIFQVSESLNSCFSLFQVFGPAAEPKFTGTGKIYCKECQLDWGQKGLFKGQQMPIIKIASFMCEDAEQNRKKFKKWKDVPFHVSLFQI